MLDDGRGVATEGVPSNAGRQLEDEHDYHGAGELDLETKVVKVAVHSMALFIPPKRNGNIVGELGIELYTYISLSSAPGLTAILPSTTVGI